MEQQQLDPNQKQMSFIDKVVNIFSSPGDLFSSIAHSNYHASNWVMPFILVIISSLIFMVVVFRQTPIQEQIRSQQEYTMQQKVSEGKMTQEQMDKTLDRIPYPGSPMWLLFGSVGVVVVLMVTLFISTLAFWLTGKIALKSSIGYKKVLEIVGLSMYIMVLSSIISMLMALAIGSIYATPSLALLVSDFNPLNTTHKFLAAANIFTFWYLAVISIGLSKVFPVTLGKAIGIVFGWWIVYTVASVLLGFGF